MTNEEKLKKLLQIAVENGANLKLPFAYIEKHFDTLNVEIVSCKLYYNNYTNPRKREKTSLNDLVTNFEKGEVSFVEALCDKNINQKMNISNLYFYNSELSLVEAVRLEWNLKPTSQRLDWLFETFKHLLI